MLREYRLTNFKAFGETVTIPIRPLTLIFGSNSSGKSSIFQSLLLLKQTLEEAKNPATALLPNGSFVNLGTYRDFVHRHETGRDFEFGARFDLDGSSDLPPLARKIINGTKAQNAALTVQFFGDKDSSAGTRHIDLVLGDDQTPMLSYLPQIDLSSGTEEEKVEIKPDSVFWHRWFKFMKYYSASYMIIFDILKAALDDDESLRPDIGSWVKRCEQAIDQCTTILLSEAKDLKWDDPKVIEIIDLVIGNELKRKTLLSNERLEKQKNYEFEEAIKDLKEAFNFSPQIHYKNFLPTDHESVFSACPFAFNYFSFEYLYSKARSEHVPIDGIVSISDIAVYICSSFRQLLENMVYLGPLRSQPRRHYEFSGDTTDYVGQSGEYLPSIFFQRPELVEQVNKDLKDLDMKYKVELDKLQYEDASPSNIFTLRLVDTETKVGASLRDVGFGISQVLPIILQNRLSEKKTLLIEQPEIHLHPAHQAELGDMFIRSALERKNTLLLETHSEHLILRILRRIRETTESGKPSDGVPPIRPEDVAVLYVQPSEGDEGAQVIEIPVTADGDFACPWPRGFFDERVKELF